MKVNLSMDDIRTKVEEYIKKAGRATGRPVLTAYYVMTADTTPDNERTNIMLALVAIVFPTSIEDVLGQIFMVGKGFAAAFSTTPIFGIIFPTFISPDNTSVSICPQPRSKFPFFKLLSAIVESPIINMVTGCTLSLNEERKTNNVNTIMYFSCFIIFAIHQYFQPEPARQLCRDGSNCLPFPTGQHFLFLSAEGPIY